MSGATLLRGVRLARRRLPLSQPIRAALAAAKHGYPSLQQMARELCISGRTLKRKLHAEGLTYRELLAEARLRRATAMLEQLGVSLEQISAELGYSSGANFSRAFQRWTGEAPGRYRERAPSGFSAVPAAVSGGCAAGA